MKYVPFILLLAPLLFWGCKKTASNVFAIDGIRDTVIGSNVGYRLPLVVSLRSGLPEMVSLSAEGLPPGVSVTFSPASGLTGFSTTATFKGSVAGTYPVKITASSASYTVSYDVTIEVSALNGWEVDGIPYRQTKVQISDSSTPGIIYLSNESNNRGLKLSMDSPLPTADGTYNYPVLDPYESAYGVSIQYNTTNPFNIYLNRRQSNTTFTLTIANGKLSGKLPATILEDTTISGMILVVDFAQ